MKAYRQSGDAVPNAKHYMQHGELYASAALPMVMSLHV
jgi:hypothetical protein